MRAIAAIGRTLDRDAAARALCVILSAMIGLNIVARFASLT